MKSTDIGYNIEIIIVLLLWFLILFSIVIQPINLILGIICVLFLPGYNLISLLKPKFNGIQKLGYSTVMSLAVCNSFMLLSYIFLYDFFCSKIGIFIFDSFFLVSSIQIINIILIIAVKFKDHQKDCDNINFKYFYNIDFNKLKKSINYYLLLFLFIYLVSIILLSISAFYSNVYNNDYSHNYRDYLENYTFFFRVPFQFYIYLIISILSLTYIIFSSKNKYLILICIFIFLYTLWILPYLQIKYYFAYDTYFYSDILKNYPKKGLKADEHSNFLVYHSKYNYVPLKYSTTIFTTIILMEFTFMDVEYVSWFIYPLMFFSVPFFIYSTFEKYLKSPIHKNLSLIILTILVFFIGQFAKNAHSATTGSIGTFIFLVLIIELYDFIQQKALKIKIKDSIIIILLYFFLCITHFEENIYFIILIFFYNICYLFFEIRKKNKNEYFILIKKLKWDLIINGFLLYILLILFYLSQEFFGYITIYLNQALFNNFPNLIFIKDFMNMLNFSLPLLKGGFYINLLIIGALTFSILIYILVSYLLLFKLYSIFTFLLKILFNFLKKVHNIIQILFKNKVFQWMIFPFFFIVILFINSFYIQFLYEESIFLIIELILNYTIILFHIFLFLKGISYYKKNNVKQNYFVLSILSVSSIMIILFIAGEIELTSYLLNSRVIPFFIFFNLIIIQNTYFEDFMKKKKGYLIAFIIIFLFLGTFFSLRKLAWG